jgi:hypothetical protein
MKQERRSCLVQCALTVGCLFAGCGDDDSNPARVDAGAATAGSAAHGGTGGNKSDAGAAAGQSGSRAQAGHGAAGKSAAAGSGASAGKTGSAGKSGGAGALSAGSGAAGSSSVTSNDNRPAAGNPDGHCDVPADAALEDVSKPSTVVGSGTPASCTGDAFVAAVAKGGVITFACGNDPVTITLTQTAKIFNDKGPKIVIDGGGKVSLSGGDKVRILYQNACDEAQVYTSSHCDNQPDPQLTVQNLTFEHGAARGSTADGGGGGAIFVRGGRFKIINSRFFNNTCDDTGPDLGGAAVRVLDQSDGKPVYVVHSTFGGRDGLGNACSNGGGLSSIGVSYTVLNDLFSYNKAIGNGANPAADGTPGGGSGGAIYNDGNMYTLTVCGTLIEHNSANEGGGAIFYVSNDHSGSLVIQDSTLRQNPNLKFETDGYPGIFVLDTDDKPAVTNSTIMK